MSCCGGFKTDSKRNFRGDGFNIGYAISPGSFEDFARYVTPELNIRGRIAPRPVQPLTLRERLFGEGQRYRR